MCITRLLLSRANREGLQTWACKRQHCCQLCLFVTGQCVAKCSEICKNIKGVVTAVHGSLTDVHGSSVCGRQQGLLVCMQVCYQHWRSWISTGLSAQLESTLWRCKFKGVLSDCCHCTRGFGSMHLARGYLGSLDHFIDPTRSVFASDMFDSFWKTSMACGADLKPVGFQSEV